MEIKISEPDLSFIVSCLGNSNSDLLTHLQSRFKSASFSIDADNAIQLRGWLKKKFQLINCGGKCELEKDKKMLFDIITHTHWSTKLVKGRNVTSFMLPKTHIEFLKSHLQNSGSYLFEVLQNGKIASYFNLDDELSVELSDWAGEQLQYEGFDKDYNLTRSGHILENIIDLLSDLPPAKHRKPRH